MKLNFETACVLRDEAELGRRSGRGRLLDVVPVDVDVALSAIGRGMTLSLLMVYLHDIRGFSIAFGGAVMAWGALFGIICTPPLGSLVDHIGPKKVMLAGLVISGFSALAFAFVTTQAHALIAITNRRFIMLMI